MVCEGNPYLHFLSKWSQLRVASRNALEGGLPMNRLANDGFTQYWVAAMIEMAAHKEKKAQVRNAPGPFRGS